MVLPFDPMTLTFKDLHYFVEIPKVGQSNSADCPIHELWLHQVSSSQFPQCALPEVVVHPGSNTAVLQIRLMVLLVPTPNYRGWFNCAFQATGQLLVAAASRSCCRLTCCGILEAFVLPGPADSINRHAGTAYRTAALAPCRMRRRGGSMLPRRATRIGWSCCWASAGPSAPACSPASWWALLHMRL